MFEINNGSAKIDGANGNYDNKNITNPSEKYGRNAVNNYYSYLEQPLAADMMNPAASSAPILDFSGTPAAAEENIKKLENYTNAHDAYLNSLPPLEYEYRYMPNIHKPGEVDKEALMGAAYEELGRRKEVSVKDIDNNMAIDNDFTAEPLDINKDGKVDIGEYASTILAADMFSKSDTPITGNIDGTINQNGHKKVFEYTSKNNAQAAASLYKSIYNQYNLGEAAKNFKPQE
jgi:hypothetical protein